MQSRFWKIVAVSASVSAASLLWGCTPGPNASQSKVVRVDATDAHDTQQAKALNQRAAGLMDGANQTEAERLLKQSIEADTDFGPAHNNLGVLYFGQSKLYPAAQQFMLAAELMPRDPRPQNGLGLVLEASGRFDDAIPHYDRARALDPDSLEYLGNDARAHVRRGDHTAELRSMLQRLANEDQRPAWNQWARRAALQVHPPTTGLSDSSGQ